VVEAKYPYYPTIYRNVNPYSSKTRYNSNSFRPLYATLPYIKPSPPPPSSLRTTFAPTSPLPTTMIQTETSTISNEPFDEVVTALAEVGNEIVVQSSLNIEVENKTNICGDGKSFQAGPCIVSVVNNDSNDEKYTKEAKSSIDDEHNKNHSSSNEDDDIRDDNEIDEITQEDKSVVKKQLT
jgi:hypothetical protein